MTNPTSPSDRAAASPLSAGSVYLMFFASGAAALTYQVIWARWLGLIMGNTTLSISIVLGAFMLGLGLGSWLAGRWMHRIRRPMMTYAALELGIGIYAIVLPVLLQGSNWLFVHLISTETPVLAGLVTRAVIAFLLLVVPTTLMGATLPLLTEFFRRHPLQTRGWKVGLLYAVNTFGAAAGTLIASFLLFESIGVRSTNHAAAALNFLVTAIAWHLAGRAREGTAPAPEPPRAASPGSSLVMGALAASGAAALASEILWTRPLSTLVGNSTYAFATILLVYLTGIGLGSWLMAMLLHRLRSLALWLGGLLAATGVWIIVAIWLTNRLHEYLLSHYISWVSLTQMFAIFAQCVSILLPLAMLSGAMFPLATRLLQPDSHDAEGGVVARAYAWNTFGALAGSLVTGFLIAPRWDFFPALYLLAAGYGLIALAAVGWAGRLNLLAQPRRRSIGIVCALSAITIGVGLQRTGAENPMLVRMRNRHSNLEVAFHRPGLQGVTTVVKNKNEPFGSHLLINGRGMTAKVTDTKMMAHLPLLLHPNPQNTLIICFGMGTTYRSAITHGGKVTVIELVPEVLEAFDKFHANAAQARAYPNGRMTANDGRNFLNLTRERYDVITVDPPPPIDAAGVNSLYSREFVELAKSRLKEGGIFAHWIPFPGTAGVYDMATFNMLVSTISHVFPKIYVLRGIDGFGGHVLGANQAIQVDLPRIKQRLALPAIAQDVSEWRKVPLEFFSTLGELRVDEMAEVPEVTDDDPILEFNLLRNWKFKTPQANPIVPW